MPIADYAHSQIGVLDEHKLRDIGDPRNETTEYRLVLTPFLCLSPWITSVKMRRRSERLMEEDEQGAFTGRQHLIYTQLVSIL